MVYVVSANDTLTLVFGLASTVLAVVTILVTRRNHTLQCKNSPVRSYPNQSLSSNV